MNIMEYLDNPLGKGAILPGKNFIIDDYNRRFMNLVMDNKITYKILTSGDEYFIHLLISTESKERDNNYDVIIRFFPGNVTQKVSTTIKNYDIEVFSNCPSFTYTYAYAYNMNGLLISDLKDKYSKEILSKPPMSRNPGIIVNYEKSIYFACKYIIENDNLLSKTHLKANSSKLTKKYIKENIRSNSKIEFEIKQSKVKNGSKQSGSSKTTRQPIQIKADEHRISKQSKKNNVNKITPKSSSVKPKAKIKARKR